MLTIAQTLNLRCPALGKIHYKMQVKFSKMKVEIQQHPLVLRMPPSQTELRATGELQVILPIHQNELND